MNLIQKLSRYTFAVTILWIGFILAIAYMETPLRFQPEQVSRKQALSIGHLVFHALNYVEVFFAGVCFICITFGQTLPVKIRNVFGLIAIILIVQTALLFTVLDWRTEAIIRGEDVPKAMYHAVYIGLDVVKLFLLVVLATLQIRWFERSTANRETEG